MVLPIIAPSVVGIGLFGFTLSWDEVARSSQGIGDLNTLPLELEGLTTTVTNPEIYALGTLTTGVMRVRELWARDHTHLLLAAASCCDAELGPEGQAGVGDPTELAILLAATFCSFWINNTAVALMMMPVALAVAEQDKSGKMAIPLLLGVAYKKDVNDVRESPALSIIDRLRAKGANVKYHDPFVPEVRFDEAHTDAAKESLTSVSLTNEELESADCVIIVTDHSEIDYKRVCSLAPLIVDTRNALNGELRRESRARIIRL